MARAPPPDTQVLPSAAPVCVSPLVPPVAIFVPPPAVLTSSLAPPMVVEVTPPTAQEVAPVAGTSSVQFVQATDKMVFFLF